MVAGRAIAERDDSNGKLIGQLISDAQSLISEYYPSTIVSDIATLTWPSVVVINGATLTVPHTSTSMSTFETSILTTSTISSPSVQSTPAVSTPVSTSGTSLSSATSSPSISSVEAVQAASPTSSVAPSSATPSSDAGVIGNTQKGLRLDKRLGVGLGISLGLVAIGLLVFLLVCMRRRKRKTGSYQKYGAGSKLLDDSEIWRTPESSAYQTRIWSEKPAPYEHTTPSMPMLSAPAPIAAAGMRHDSNGTGSSGSGYHTPYSGPAELAASRSSDHLPVTAAAHQPHESNDAGFRRNRPAIPLMHTAMMNSHARTQRPEYVDSPVSPITPHQAEYSNLPPSPNPFWSPDDFEANRGHRQSYHSENPFRHPDDGYESLPPPPPRSPHRRYSPQIHYPSGTEISNFDFGLTSQQLHELRQAGEHGPDPLAHDSSYDRTMFHGR
ncbi:hypothetical protein MBLNU457_5627t1 [Dothideomycetes sp. NU457]